MNPDCFTLGVSRNLRAAEESVRLEQRGQLAREVGCLRTEMFIFKIRLRQPKK